MSIKDCIKAARLKKGYSQEELGRMIGVAKQTIQKYENGIISNIPSDKIEAIAKALGTTPAYIMGWEPEASNIAELFRFENIEPLPATVLKPLLGEIACGEPILAQENIEDMVPVPDNIHCDFVLRCKGDSMKDAKINDGDIVYVRQQPEVENGEIAAVLIDEEATLKRVYWRDADRLELHPANPDFPVLVYMGNELENVKILGKAIGCLFAIR